MTTPGQSGPPKPPPKAPAAGTPPKPPVIRPAPLSSPSAKPPIAKPASGKPPLPSTSPPKTLPPQAPSPAVPPLRATFARGPSAKPPPAKPQPTKPPPAKAPPPKTERPKFSPPAQTLTARVVVTFTDEGGTSQVSLARLYAPDAYLRYWVEDSQPLAHLHLGHRLHDVECTRATPNDPDFGTQSWPLVRVAKNEPHSSGDHLVVLEPLDESSPSEGTPEQPVGG